MHTDHAAVFAWLTEHVPGGRLYGPYDHSGRRYYQWMARGAFLRDELVPLLDRWLGPQHSERANDRYLRMKTRYGLGGRSSAASAFPAERPRHPDRAARRTAARTVANAPLVTDLARPEGLAILRTWCRDGPTDRVRQRSLPACIPQPGTYG